MDNKFRGRDKFRVGEARQRERLYWKYIHNKCVQMVRDWRNGNKEILRVVTVQYDDNRIDERGRILLIFYIAA